MPSGKRSSCKATSKDGGGGGGSRDSIFIRPSAPVGEDGRTPAMSSTSSVLRVFATWAATVVPNVMGPKGMRLGGPSLAPVGVNKHKLYLDTGRERETEKEEVRQT